MNFLSFKSISYDITKFDEFLNTQKVLPDSNQDQWITVSDQ